MPHFNKIKVMSESLSMKIAAGEVVGRPASVVKELVENSIDARATDISVFIRDGGRKLIKVVDNGEGMMKTDIALAFERHATSKLMREEDLHSITTMGFRGEALPSIAAVADIVLTTKTFGELCGSAIKIRGGKVENIVDAGCAVGTVVEVKDLFYNTPARLKFMRSVSTEIGHIQDVVTRLALSYPAIRFRLYNNDSVLLEASTDADLKTRIADVFGREFLKSVVPVEGGDNVLKVHGFIARPETSYMSTKGLFVYVNNRWIKDRGVNHAIANGYRNMLADKKYPFVVLFITVPPPYVDVNVHPAKYEVRFRSPRDVYGLVRKVIEGALAPSYISSKQLENGMPAAEVKEDAGVYKTHLHVIPDNDGFVPARQLPYQHEFAESGDEGRPLLAEPRIIGQLWAEYLLCEREGEFYIIDQHAAAERIAFERLKEEYYVKHRISSQMLLIPQTVDVSLQERDALENSLEVINALGFDIERFGGNTYVMRAIPELLSGIDCRGLVKELADELAASEMSFKIEGKMDETLMCIACHGAIRGKRLLTKEEARSLLKRLGEADFADNCPHGRPVIRVISRVEIERMFKRR